MPKLNNFQQRLYDKPNTKFNLQPDPDGREKDVFLSDLLKVIVRREGYKKGDERIYEILSTDLIRMARNREEKVLNFYETPEGGYRISLTHS